jgi:hypothetical protein
MEKEEFDKNSNAALIRTQIENLGQEIDKYHQHLNQQSIWLFLAVLGCWGVTNHWYQLVAFVISFSYFGWQLIDGLQNRTSFKSQFKELEIEISNPQFSDDQRDANQHRLTRVKEKVDLKKLHRTWPWFTSMAFLVASVVNLFQNWYVKWQA